jgi:hypothetical protein
MVFLVTGEAIAGQEPKGLILRKGQVRWGASIKEARQFIEADVKPDRIPRLIKPPPGEKEEEEGFSCSKGDEPGVLYCRLACCVDLGEKNIVHFATMWFHNDRFYGYRVTFNTNYFNNLTSALGRRFGKPTKEDQETVTAPNPLAWQFGFGTFLKHTKRWETETTIIMLSDRGGEGKALVGEMVVVYVPILREVSRTREKNEPKVDLPF